MPCSVPHDFLNHGVADDGTPHVSHGYPDECERFARFVDSLAGIIDGGPWRARPTKTIGTKAIVVDFVSKDQRQAESSLVHGWNGAREFPMGVINTVHSRTETNQQNARMGRHLALVATGMTHKSFCDVVVERLLDRHTCADPRCEVCRWRSPRTLADVVQILAAGTGQSVVHLFSKWTQQRDLLEPLAVDGITIETHELCDIPLEVLEANSSYHIWDGTAQQAAEFREHVWRPW